MNCFWNFILTDPFIDRDSGPCRFLLIEKNIFPSPTGVIGSGQWRPIPWGSLLEFVGCEQWMNVLARPPVCLSLATPLIQTFWIRQLHCRLMPGLHQMMSFKTEKQWNTEYGITFFDQKWICFVLCQHGTCKCYPSEIAVLKLFVSGVVEMLQTLDRPCGRSR